MSETEHLRRLAAQIRRKDQERQWGLMLRRFQVQAVYRKLKRERAPRFRGES